MNYPPHTPPIPPPFPPVIQPLVPQWTPSIDAIQQQTAANNAVAGHLQSWRRRATEEQKAVDTQNINALVSQLAQCPISPLPTGLEICASPPVRMLPERARQLISAVASTCGVPIEMPLVCLLGAITIASRGKFKVRVTDRHEEVVTEYFLASAASGQRKSAVVDFFRKIIVQEEVDLQRGFSNACHETAHHLWRRVIKKEEAELANRLRDLVHQHGDRQIAQSLLSAEMAELERLKTNSHKRTVPPRLLFDMATPEKLAAEMACQGEAMGIFEAEGGSLRKIIRSGHHLDLYLKGYTGECCTFETKTNGSVHLNKPVLGICIVAQHSILDAVFRNPQLAERGLAPRFLPLFIPSNSGAWNEYPVDIPAPLIEWYTEWVQKMVCVPIPIGPAGERSFHALELSWEAAAEVDRYRRTVDRQMRNGDFEHYAPFGDKLVGHAVRLAGIAHLLKHEAPQSHPIDEETMACGTALAEFFRRHAAAAFSPDARDGVTYAPMILKWMRRHRVPYFTERDAHRGIGSGRHTIAQVRAGIDELERSNYLRSLFASTDRIHVVHPSAHLTF